MLLYWIITFAAASLAGAAPTLECSNDDCFHAVNHVASDIRASDCQSLFEVTVTPATSTVMRTVVVQTTGTTTKTILSTDKTAATTSPSKRWQDQRDARGALLRRSEPHQTATSPPKKTPDYAAPCGSVKALSSVCSCMGYEHTTTTALAPETTKTVTLHETGIATAFKTVKTAPKFPVPLNRTSAVFHNSTAARFGNSTTAAGNSTRSGSTSRSAATSFRSSLASLSDSARAFASSVRPGQTETTGALGATATTSARNVNSGNIVGSSGGPLTASSSNPRLPTGPGSRTSPFSTTSKAPFAKATTTSAPLFANSTSARSNTTNSHTSVSLASSGRFLNTTKPAVLSASSTVSFSNSSTSVSAFRAPSTTAKLNSTSAPFSNATTPAPFMNTTSLPSTSATLAPFMNSTAPATLANVTSVPSLNATRPPFALANATTSAPLFHSIGAPFSNNTRLPFANATRPPFALANATTSAPFLNSTGIPRFNTTRPPYANVTSFRAFNTTAVRFSNTSAPTATPTSTTSSMTCGETSSPFMLKVSQPSGLFDGWFARILANTIMFTSSVNQSSKFSVESSGYLCAVGYKGEDGNSVIAIVEDKKGLTGSAVYLIDEKRMEDLGKQGYGPLDCAVNGDLACQGGQELSNWVGCGLGLDISSDAGENVVVDGWNCTSVALSAIYE
ncbi:hypothetical protein PGQ11_004520 [Apiospora arundinis]|uniref:Uncharacterized protein n=1 Tax=Apiospora arundinis TaxID=335852 RepID=A0ABR2J898_9PEZI